MSATGPNFVGPPRTVGSLVDDESDPSFMMGRAMVRERVGSAKSAFSGRVHLPHGLVALAICNSSAGGKPRNI